LVVRWQTVARPDYAIDRRWRRKQRPDRETSPGALPASGKGYAWGNHFPFGQQTLECHFITWQVI
jgi:hypothetical protein